MRVIKLVIIIALAQYFHFASIGAGPQFMNESAIVYASASDTTAGNLPAIDTFALNAPATIDESPEKVAAYLLNRCSNDVQKARAAFAWIAFHIRYDDNAYNSGKPGDMSPRGVLKRKHAVCEGYANLYKAIAEAMGLQAERIDGYAKAYGYRTGEKFEGLDPNHSWNAVKINGEWTLLDVTWGAGHAEGGRGRLVSRKEFTPYFFNVNNYEFLFKHYPKDPQWLQIPEAISLKQYQDMPLIAEPLFMMGFDAHLVLNKFLDKTLPKQLPEAYFTKFSIKQVNLPLNGTIQESKEATFSLVCAEDVDIVVANNIKTWFPMKKVGNIYSLTMPVNKGDLLFTIKSAASHGSYAEMMKYKVVKQ